MKEAVEVKAPELVQWDVQPEDWVSPGCTVLSPGNIAVFQISSLNHFPVLFTCLDIHTFIYFNLLLFLISYFYFMLTIFITFSVSYHFLA